MSPSLRPPAPPEPARDRADADRPGVAVKRVLLIAYAFPPVGGAGVQRATKFVKYLPLAGWSPSVLTVANPSVPVTDESLGADVPGSTIIRRARTWEPSYALKSVVSAGSDRPDRGRLGLRRAAKGLARRLANLLLQPDAQVLWMPGAIREGEALLREIPHAAIVATAPPFSSFLVGATLSRRTGVPLVLDYRDEWDLSGAHLENRRPDPLSRSLQVRMQARAIRAAKALVATTRASARTLESLRAGAGGEARVTWIYNGFDPDDFPPDTPRPEPGGRYRLAYVGTLWNLTSAAPLVAAVRELARSRPDLVSDLELVFAGRRTGPQQQLLDGLDDLPCRVVEHPYVGHREAIDLLRSADGLCLLLADVPGAGRVVPAKLFEYMAARRPILAIAPRGEVWELLEGHPSGYPADPGDIMGIAGWLAQEIRRRREGGPPDPGDWDCSRYDRSNQARQLADLLDSIR